jgi:superfamily II DNA or RNA helicase
MPKEFIIIVNSHRKLGELLVPYFIERVAGQSFFQLLEIATSENSNNQKLNLSAQAIKVIEIAYEYSEKTLHKTFSKNKNLKDFFNTIEESLITQQIRPYIEKRISKCIEIISGSDLLIYKKEKNYMVVHDEELINVIKQPVQPVFNFIKTDSDFKYFLSLRGKGKDIKLFNQHHSILSQKPCIVIVGKELLRVENIDSKKLLPFFTRDLITIPKSAERDYLDTFVKNAILNFPVKAIGFKIIEVNVEPKASLTLEPNLSGRPVLMLRFIYERAVFSYGSQKIAEVFLEEKDNTYIYFKYNRKIDVEERNVENLISSGFENEVGMAFKMKLLSGSPDQQFFEFINWLNRNTCRLRELGFEINKPKTDKDYYLGSILLDLKIDDSLDWFDLKAVVTFGEFIFPFTRFRKHIIMGIREFTLPNNQVVILPDEWFANYREIFVFGNDEGDKIQLKKHHFQMLREAIGDESGNTLLKLSNKLELANTNDFKVPEKINATLREYQKVGANWMYQMYSNNFGGCLADDMGLGKTLQTLTLLMKVKEEISKSTVIPASKKSTHQLSLFDIPAFTGGEPLNTSLIVMPVSLLHNWENEINKFAPSLSVYKFFGTQRTRNFNELLTVDIVLASYGVVRNDIESLRELNFKYVILDESQSIKNPDSKIYKAVVQLQSEHKLVLTGTPIENSLTDLWAQLNFLNRDLLKSQHYFREEFVVPIEKHNDIEKQKKLQVIISPFILRRKKEEVVKELPSLTEQLLYCEMTEEQHKIYEKEKSYVRNMLFDTIDKQGYEKSAILILKALNKLRLLANHPILTEPDYEGDSGKFDEIMRSIENVVEEKHKVLIFSSYVKHLNLVAEYLKKQAWPFTMLTGAIKNRQNVIDKFQKEEDTRVFLISLKAGGTGLNLTAADYVFMLDPWWNPASENQAISRAHRIGQDKKVFVYRFLSRDTIEEKIQLLQQRKSAMADLFINNNNPFKSIRKEDIVDLFK